MQEFYHYTIERNVASIKATGIYPNHPYFTPTEYFSANQAGQALGVMPDNIDCVLKFKNDGLFKSAGIVADSGRLVGGGHQYQHPLRPKPIAVRKIGETIWKSI